MGMIVYLFKKQINLKVGANVLSLKYKIRFVPEILVTYVKNNLNGKWHFLYWKNYHLHVYQGQSSLILLNI